MVKENNRGREIKGILKDNIMDKKIKGILKRIRNNVVGGNHIQFPFYLSKSQLKHHHIN